MVADWCSGGGQNCHRIEVMYLYYHPQQTLCRNIEATRAISHSFAHCQKVIRWLEWLLRKLAISFSSFQLVSLVFNLHLRYILTPKRNSWRQPAILWLIWRVDHHLHSKLGGLRVGVRRDLSQLQAPSSACLMSKKFWAKPGGAASEELQCCIIVDGFQIPLPHFSVNLHAAEQMRSISWLLCVNVVE
jgi:hypothetical protein